MKEKLRFTVFLKKLFLVEKVIFEPRFSKLLLLLKNYYQRGCKWNRETSCREFEESLNILKQILGKKKRKEKETIVPFFYPSVHECLLTSRRIPDSLCIFFLLFFYIERKGTVDDSHNFQERNKKRKKKERPSSTKVFSSLKVTTSQSGLVDYKT